MPVPVTGQQSCGRNSPAAAGAMRSTGQTGGAGCVALPGTPSPWLEEQGVAPATGSEEQALNLPLL